MSDQLHSIPRKLDQAQRSALLAGGDLTEHEVPLERLGGSPAEMETLDALMAAMRDRLLDGQWPDRSTSDRWLAPRIHHALRLFRVEAAERGIWQWVAMRYPWYLEWRWSDRAGSIASDRWWGPIHKQAFARLWWGAEIFRDGADYQPAERAFVFQDLPNSYLHRPVVRCRSLALALVRRFDEANSPTAKQVNGLARVLNLTTVGSPLEVETGYQNDDLDSYSSWVTADIALQPGWDDLPEGPPAIDTTVESRAGGERVVDRGWTYAGLN